MRTRHLLSVAIATLTLSGCYHQVVQTGPAPAAGAQVIDRPWQLSFVYGLIPPPEVDATVCPGGVARVETQHTFLNSLVAVVTFGIVTPMRVIVTCGGAASGIDAPMIEAGESAGARAAALDQAIRVATETGASVLIRF